MPWPLLLVALSAAPSPAASPKPAESELAAAAQREAARRGRVKGSPTYTDEDLRPAGAGPAGSTGSVESGAPAATSYAPPAGKKLGDDGGEVRPTGGAGVQPDERDQQMDADAGADSALVGWRDRLREARSRVAEARVPLAKNHQERDDARAKLNPMSMSYVPDTSQQLQAQAALADLAREEGELQQAVDEAEAALRQLEDEARRNRVPARWLEPASPQR